MSLLDLLACPSCRSEFDLRGGRLECRGCRRAFAIRDGVPILTPDGEESNLRHEGALETRTGYEPYVQQLLDSLPPSEPVLDVGAGNRSIDDPRVVRLDLVRTPHLDVIGDAHALPFRDGSFAFVHASAMLEHLAQPFLAASEILRVLKPGGHVLADCAFVFPFHGFPAVYFNASGEGLRSLFRDFTEVSLLVAPWQMPSFALSAVLGEYLKNLSPETEEARAFAAALRDLGRFHVRELDRYFTEDGARRIAAGLTYLGAKRPLGVGSLVPEPVMRAWSTDPELKRRHPRPWALVTSFDGETGIDSLMTWARGEGQRQVESIRACFKTSTRFSKALHAPRAVRPRTRRADSGTASSAQPA